ncbi:MAG: two-component regulator propeller domain-containing protein [Saprospiraceae bacterium]
MQHVFASFFSLLRQNQLLVCLLLVAGFGESIHAQNVAIGEWQTHLAYPRAIDVSSCEAFTVYATTEAIVYQYHDRQENQKLDKVNALSQANPAFVACNPYKEGQVIVLYEDGAIDILEDEKVVHYITAIADATIIGRRGMREISFAAENLAFISTDFGYLLLDPVQGVLPETVRTSSPINDVAVLGADLYLATDQGVLMLPDFRIQSTLVDTTQYQNLSLGILNTGTEKAFCIEEWKDEIYVGFNDKAFILSSRGTAVEQPISGLCADIVDITAGPNNLILSISGCGGIKRVRTSSTGRTFTSLDNTCLGSALFSAVEAPNGRISIAGSGSTGFLYYDEVDGRCRTVEGINGPSTSDVFDIDILDGVVAVAAGGISDQSGYTGNYNGVFLYQDGVWNTFNNTSRDIFSNPDATQSPADISTVSIVDGQKIFAGAFYEGLVFLDLADESQDIIYDERNSSLRTHLGDPLRTRIAGSTFDKDGNLWVSNFGAERALSVRTPEGEWTSFSMASCNGGTFLRAIEVDPNTGIAWVHTTNGVIAYDTKGTFSDTSDDECRTFTKDDGLPTADVKSMIRDRDGVIWVGTSNGIALISCTGNPFSSDCNAFRPPVVVDDIPGFFFDGELIRSMEVDGGNRKWIGTDNGLFLLDASGDDQLAFYNIDNSPLLDNKITALAFDDETGALWIGTGNGIMTLQTEATGSNDFFFSNVEVFPQPVRPDYDGPIAIRGLATNANVKITDAQGRLVYETDAVGGQAVWDGRDYNGGRPASGVYFVWATATKAFNAPEAVVAKIALLR